MNRFKTVFSLCICSNKAADDEIESDGCDHCGQVLEKIDTWLANLEKRQRTAEADSMTLLHYRYIEQRIPENEVDNILDPVEHVPPSIPGEYFYADRINGLIKRTSALGKKIHRCAEIWRHCVMHDLTTCTYEFSKEKNIPIASSPKLNRIHCRCKYVPRIVFLQEYILELRIKMDLNDRDLLRCTNRCKAIYPPNYRIQEEEEEQAVEIIIEEASENENENEEENPVLSSLSDDKDDMECYSMNYQSRGKCIFFGNEFFNSRKLDQRKNITEEKIMIEKTFSNMGFEIESYIDFNYSKIKKVLNKLVTYNFENDDCICIIISTHGREDELWAKDVCYPLEIFENKLASIKSLVNKPKVFFIQSCRGLQVDQGIGISETSDSSDDEIDGSVKSIKVPKTADFYKVYSSPPGYLSWRGWFLKELCKNFDKYSETKDIESIVKITSTEIRKLESNSCNILKNKAKQVPYVEHTLDKKVFFRKKLN